MKIAGKEMTIDYQSRKMTQSSTMKREEFTLKNNHILQSSEAERTLKNGESSPTTWSRRHSEAEEEPDDDFYSHLDMIQKQLDELDSFNRSSSISKRPQSPTFALNQRKDSQSQSLRKTQSIKLKGSKTQDLKGRRQTPFLNVSEISKEIPYRSTSHPSQIFSLPPKLVVRAAKTKSQSGFSPNELLYTQGTFFYVIDEKKDSEWFEVIDPVKKERGIVPKSDFVNVKQGCLPTPSTSCTSASTSSLSPYRDDQPPNLVYDSFSNTRILVPPFPSIQEPRNLNYKLSESIVAVDVPHVELDPLTSTWMYTIHLQLSSNETRLLYRSFADFWSLHLILLSFFPAQAGYDTTPRLFPFLPPYEKVNEDGVQIRRKILLFYLDYLLFKLDSEIVDSFHLDGFFQPHHVKDITTPLSLLFDSSSALLDLINHVSSPPDSKSVVEITFVLGESRFHWTTFQTTTHDQLCQEISHHLGFEDFEDILYKDEAGEMIVIHGNDLRLLFVLDHVTLYCS